MQELSDIEFLYIMKLPSFDGKIDIMFEDGFSLIDFKIKVYKDIIDKNVTLSFETCVAKGSITFISKSKGANVNYESELNENIENPRVLLDYFKSFSRMTQGVKFTILKDGNSVFSHKLIKRTISDDLVFMIDYLEKLLKVESLHMTRFRDLNRNEINDTNYHKIKCLIAKAENSFIEEETPILTAILDENYDKEFLSINEEQHLVFMGENYETKISLHNKEFVLGYKKSFIFDPIIFNIDDIKSKKATEAKIGSKTGKTRVAYYDTYDMPTT
jgi:hypothetical protein